MTISSEVQTDAGGLPRKGSGSRRTLMTPGRHRLEGHRARPDVARSRFSRALVALSLLCLPACTILHTDVSVVRTSPLPEPIRSHFDYSPGFREISCRVERQEDGYEVRRVRLQVSDDVGRATSDLELEDFRVTAPGRRPAVVVTPILKGKQGIVRILAGILAERGFHAVILHNPDGILDPQQDSAALERAFRGSIVDLRRAVDWLALREDVDPARLGSMGVSLGAIRNAVLAAVEPRLRAHVLLLGGADLPGILMQSVEGPVCKYREARLEANGGSEEALLASLREAFFYDDQELGRSVDPRSVLLFLARFDRTVPYENGLLLRERLGRPETVVIPSGHYSAAAFLPYAATRAVRFLDEKLR